MTRVDELAHYLLFMINKNAPTGAPVSLAWRLVGEMRRRLIVHETGFTRWRFLLPTLSTSIVLQDNNFLFVSELIEYACWRRPEIRLRTQAIRLYKYTKIQGPRLQRNYIFARDQKDDLHNTSFQSSPKINRVPITRSISIQWKFTTPDHRSFANYDS